MRASTTIFTLTLACLAAVAAALDSRPITLGDALKLAKENNGSVRAAALRYESAKASAKASYAAFLPTVTPTLSQENGRFQQNTGAFRGGQTIDTTSALIEANWRLFDMGFRRLDYRQAVLDQESSERSALQTLRATLFDVHSKFFEGLRRQELLKVQDRNLARAKEILDQTKFRASDQVGDAPRKDIRQAEADFLNARVSQLSASNLVAVALANLKAVLGVGLNELGELKAPESAAPQPLTFSLDEAIAEGLKNRADLEASRKGIESSKLRLRSIELNAGINLTADVNYRKSFAEDNFDRASLVLRATYPLYDGRRTKELVRSQQLSVKSQEATLVQTERDVKAEIEGSYKQYTQNIVRLEAATAALDAARVNYQAALESQRLGAGNLIEVLTAQVSLATAESNYVEAVYDTAISEVRLRLAIGREMPGEKE